MKDISPDSTAPSLIEAIVPLRHAHWHIGVDAAANIVTLPGAGARLVLARRVVLRRARAPRTAARWPSSGQARGSSATSSRCSPSRRCPARCSIPTAGRSSGFSPPGRAGTRCGRSCSRRPSPWCGRPCAAGSPHGRSPRSCCSRSPASTSRATSWEASCCAALLIVLARDASSSPSPRLPPELFVAFALFRDASESDVPSAFVSSSSLASTADSRLSRSSSPRKRFCSSSVRSFNVFIALTSFSPPGASLTR